MTARVLLVDDQRVVRDGLALILENLPGVECVGAAEDGERAVALAAALQPDVVLMDLRMPGMDGVQATAMILDQCPSTRIVVLTTYSDDESIFAALRAGARGYLTKDCGSDEILRAIERVMAGEALLDPAVQSRVLESLTSIPMAGPPPRTSRHDPLTPREREVLSLIAAGMSNQDIAARLFVGEATVKTHVNRVFAKIGARDRAQAVAYAFRNGLAQP